MGMRSFQEYMKSSGATEKKAVVDPSGDQVDMPKPKAKDDPHHTNKKTKGEHPQVKEGAETDKYDNVRKVKGQYVFDSETAPQVKGDGKLPFSKSKSYDTKDGVEQVKEYLASQGKLVTKPSEEMVADYHGPNPNAPTQAATSGKGWKGGTNDGSPSPYRAPGMSPNDDGPHGGLGYMGGTKYEPNTKGGDSPHVPGGKSSSEWPGSKTEAFLNNTKDMSMQEFTAYMLDECSCGSNNIVAIKQLASAITECPKSMEVLVYELKQQGGLGMLVEMLMSHQETFTELNRVLADEEEGKSRCHSLVRAMTEAVGPPWGKDEDEDEDEEGEEDLHPDDDDEDEDEDDEDLGDVDSDPDFDDDAADSDDDEMDDEYDDEEDEDEEEPSPSAGGNLANAIRKHMYMRKMLGI